MSDVEQVVAKENGGVIVQDEKKKEFDVTACKCKSVVVFLDRAEVSRSLNPCLTQGENEVFITGMSGFLDEDSVRYDHIYAELPLMFQ